MEGTMSNRAKRTIVAAILMFISLILALAIFKPFKLEGQLFIKSSIQEKDIEHSHTPDEYDDKLIVRISDEEMKTFGIEVSTAKPGKLRVHLNLPGEVVYDPDRLAYITPRFPGIVQE
jgi:hypothetical protein